MVSIPLPESTSQAIAKRQETKRLAGLTAHRTAKRGMSVDGLIKGRLKPWMVAYCQWLAAQLNKPTIEEKKLAAAKAAKVHSSKFSVRAIRSLEARPDFKELRTKYESDLLARARDGLELELEKGVRVYGLALDEMERRLEEEPDGADLRLVPGLVGPALDRVSPKKAEAGTHLPTVTIHLTAPRAQLVDQEPIDVDYEVVQERQE